MQKPVVTGYLLALLGVTVLSPDALLVRLAGDDPFAISVWRGLIAGSMILIYNQLLDRRSWKMQVGGAGKRLGLLIVLNAFSQLGFVAGISYTNVTEVLIIIAFAPLLSALLSAVFLAEKILLRTWVATLVCGVGLAVLFAQPSEGNSFLGQAAAVMCAVTMAAQFVIIRSAPDSNLTIGVGLGNVLYGTFCVFIASSLVFQGEALISILLMGLIVSPIPFVLFIISLRHITAAETSLILLLESVMGTFWVWLFLDEWPTTQTLLAGLLVLVTLAVYGFMALRESHKKPVVEGAL